MTGAIEVSFNGTSTAFTVVAQTEITAAVPASATTGTITVTTPGGALASNLPFRVTAQITRFAPTSGAVGTVVTITGVELDADDARCIRRSGSTLTVDSDKKISASVPTGAVTGAISVPTPGGTTVRATSFTVN
jgi:hypothetical protein